MRTNLLLFYLKKKKTCFPFKFNESTIKVLIIINTKAYLMLLRVMCALCMLNLFIIGFSFIFESVLLPILGGDLVILKIGGSNYLLSIFRA